MKDTETDFTPAAAALSPASLDRLASDLRSIREQLLEEEARQSRVLERIHPDHRLSACNLIHYVALRRQDVRDLQARLARVGLSSLGRSEPHVLVSLDRVLAMLSLARGRAVPTTAGGVTPVGFRQGEELLRRNTEMLLGRRRTRRGVSIVVTIPEEAAEDFGLCRGLVEAGMDCARINCAHDGADTWAAMIRNLRAAAEGTGRSCRVLMDLAGPKLRIGEFDDGRAKVRIRPGESVMLELEGREDAGKEEPADWRVRCPVPEIFEQVGVEDSVWFDDGRIGGTVEWKGSAALRIRVTHARVDGSKLRAHKGINLPDTSLCLPGLTEKDLEDLTFVARHADIVALSFVQREEQVRRLQEELERLDAQELGLVLKIETRTGFERLPRLLLEAMRSPSYGVMIARGDLAVELGFERLAEVQEEILWISEAAHAPTIWATQVLETLAKTGLPSRPEITDAAMSGRAEAVMLNKGPHIVDAIRALDGILERMGDHQAKKRSLMRSLSISGSL